MQCRDNIVATICAKNDDDGDGDDDDDDKDNSDDEGSRR